MCTVTFVPVNNKVFITHSRDEKLVREKAIAPEVSVVKGSRLLFPKDGKAGGSWIGMNENGNVAILLNGAFIKHMAQPPYRRSRGLVLLDILAADDMVFFYQSLDLAGIEPFTIILWNYALLFE